MSEKPKKGAPRLDPEAFAGIDPALLKATRTKLGMTVRQVAEKAQISKTTLLKLEAGEPVRLHTKMMVCYAMGVMPDRLTALPVNFDPNAKIQVVRAGENPFRIGYTTERAPRSLCDLKKVDDFAERKRLAELGFVAGFCRVIPTRLDHTQFIVEILEVSSADGMKRWSSTTQTRQMQRHAGEEMVYCLSGPALITAGGAEAVLETGDTAFFRGEEWHDYALPPGLPAGWISRILLICINPE